MSTAKQWREAVRRSDVPVPVKLLCDYLSERMWQGRTRYNGIPRWVSVPRSVMAEDLGAPERTVDRWVSQAVKAGVLTVVRRGREGRTAEYQGLMPDTPPETGATTRESYADVRTSTEEPTHATTRESYADVAGTVFAPELRTSAHLDPRNGAGELRTSAHPIVTGHSPAADDPSVGPPDRTGVTCTPVDQRGSVDPGSRKQDEQAGRVRDLLEDRYVSPWDEETFPPDPEGER